MVKRRSDGRERVGRGMKWGRLVMGVARGRRRRRNFVDLAITAVLAFSRRGFVIRASGAFRQDAWMFDEGG